MTSPYVDPKVQRYDRGHQNHNPGIGTVTYVQNLTTSNSDGMKVGFAPRANMISGFGKVRDNRKQQNPGFTM